MIECNLRVSRSFPFVSKTLDHDFIATATKVICGEKVEPTDLSDPFVTRPKVGVKVPQFSFSRLSGAEVMLGVEMASTGEVGCFGETRYEAYLKALLSTGFRIPRANVLLSIGSYNARMEMRESVRLLTTMGYKLFASVGTAAFFKEHDGIIMTSVDWPFEEGVTTGETSKTPNIGDYMAKKHFDLIINLPMRCRGAYQVPSHVTLGYITRRMAVDNGIPLITDIKCAKLLIRALAIYNGKPPALNTDTDCFTSRRLVRLPGLVDVHVHMREPGAEHKETWETGSKAALAGGITMVLAMPNTNPPVTDRSSFGVVQKVKFSLAEIWLIFG